MDKKFDAADPEAGTGAHSAATARHILIKSWLWARTRWFASPFSCILLLLLACIALPATVLGSRLALTQSVPEITTLKDQVQPTEEHALLQGTARKELPSKTLTNGHALAALQQRVKAAVAPTTPGLSLRPGGPIPPVVQPTSATPLYLSLSAFRDGERCAKTIGFAFEKAKYPERLYIRVMQALGTMPGEVSCAEEFRQKQLKEYCGHHFAQEVEACERRILGRTKVWTIPLEEGMGPAHQRGLLNELLSFEAPDSFCMTTDSHMDFRPEWDDLTVQNWLEADNEFAVLTAYPMAAMDNQDELYAHSHVDLCGYFLEDGIPRGRTGGNCLTKPGQKPYLTMNWAAGLSFHRCHADRNVPVDKNLRFIFTGEEIDRAVRLWTNGYDLYLPTITTVYHNYTSAKQEFWSYNKDVQTQERAAARRRLGTLLELGEDFAKSLPKRDLEPYGLGTQRTLEEYVQWSRVDLGTSRWTEFLKQTGKEGPHICEDQFSRWSVKDVKKLHASILHGGPPPPKSTPAPIPM